MPTDSTLTQFCDLVTQAAGTIDGWTDDGEAPPPAAIRITCHVGATMSAATRGAAKNHAWTLHVGPDASDELPWDSAPRLRRALEGRLVAVADQGNAYLKAYRHGANNPFVVGRHALGDDEVVIESTPGSDPAGLAAAVAAMSGALVTTNRTLLHAVDNLTTHAFHLAEAVATSRVETAEATMSAGQGDSMVRLAEVVLPHLAPAMSGARAEKDAPQDPTDRVVWAVAGLEVGAAALASALKDGATIAPEVLARLRPLIGAMDRVKPLLGM
ncbi:MAG: hypothetical protein GY736_05900 [Sphingomonas sp.]|uniref:hypothetical protein n=1 Tax=Sphingomonas sp. TaxID=28214 RepID=UPI002586F52C|nr:hypothetical protein [Sphingomonas sp.]MCP4025832.1 hypothetical protein [Sphingomonas sp.]